MKAWGEFGLFLGVAAAAHLAIWQGAAGRGSPGSDGDGGQAVTLTSGDALQDLVRGWDSPPVASVAPAHLPPPAPTDLPATAAAAPTPTASTAALPMLPIPSQNADELPAPISTATPEPIPDPVDATRPPPRPANLVAPPQAPTAPRAASTAKRIAPQDRSASRTSTGAGRGQVRSKETAPVRSADPAAMARWGKAILHSIERQKRYPRGSRAKGVTSVSLTVTAAGALSDLRVSRSSGHAELDRAALDAVRRARLPAAPRGSTIASHPFTLAIRFAP